MATYCLKEGKRHTCIPCQHLTIKVTDKTYLGCQMKLEPEWKGGWGCKHQRLVEEKKGKGE